MKLKATLLIASLLISQITWAHSGHERVCPENLAEMLELIEASKDCNEAFDVALDCSRQTEVDVHIAGGAQAICEGEFQDLNALDRMYYESLIGRCEQKFSGDSSPRAQSMRAFCRLDIAKAFASAHN